MRDLSFIKSWDDATELGRTWRQAGDEARFELGDLACFVCVRREGRPLAGADDKTLTEFAKEIGEHRPAVSQMAAMSEFLPDDAERQTCFEMGVGWHTLNAARIRTGWRPGQTIDDQHRADFWHIVMQTADGQSQPNPTPADDARRALQQCDRMADALGRLLKQVGVLPRSAYDCIETAQENLIEAAANIERHIEKLGNAPAEVDETRANPPNFAKEGQSGPAWKGEKVTA